VSSRVLVSDGTVGISEKGGKTSQMVSPDGGLDSLVREGRGLLLTALSVCRPLLISCNYSHYRNTFSDDDFLYIYTINKSLISMDRKAKENELDS
jgi:hypothetical protein